MFFVYFTNFGYSADQSFSSIESALEFIKSKGFSAVITDGPQSEKHLVIGYWSILGGWRSVGL